MLLRPVLQPRREETGRQQAGAPRPHRQRQRRPEGQNHALGTEDPRPALHAEPKDERESGLGTRRVRRKNRQKAVQREKGIGTAPGKHSQVAAAGDEELAETAEGTEGAEGQWVLQWNEWKSLSST